MPWSVDQRRPCRPAIGGKPTAAAAVTAVCFDSHLAADNTRRALRTSAGWIRLVSGIGSIVDGPSGTQGPSTASSLQPSAVSRRPSTATGLPRPWQPLYPMIEWKTDQGVSLTSRR